MLLHIRRRTWVIAALVAGGLTILMIAAATRIPFSSTTLRKRVIATLADRLDAEVELKGLTLRLYPRLHAIGTGLTIRSAKFAGRDDVPPLISVDTFVVDAGLVGLWRRRVAHVRLEGLNIQIPPGEAAPSHSAQVDPSSNRGLQDSAAPAGTDDRRFVEADDYFKQVVITDLEAPDAQLVILRRDKAQEPKTWYLHMLRMQSVSAITTMPFETLLTNGVPPGQINARGTFGPWDRDDPGRTPLDGRFTYDNADLSVFNGISGILAARGTFRGTLDRIETDGETDTPDFMVNISHHAVPLRTTYHAIVDATNGATTLDPVHATFLDTSFTATGGVYEMAGVKGRTVKLDVAIEKGRLDDIMRLVVNTPQAPMTGRLHLKTTLILPPGERDVVDKLQLNGRFVIEGGKFTDSGVQARINELSRRASGRARQDVTETKVASDFHGEFRLAGSQLTLPVVTFDIPGAVVELAGRYGLRRETIAFDGALYMDAKISQTMTGFRSLLLKLVDPLFRKNGRTVVPLKIGGTRNDPQFGLDLKRALRRSTPPQQSKRTAGPTTTR